MDVKPGFLTSEFWLVVANTIFMALVAFGILGQQEAAEIQALVVPLIGAVLGIVVYVWGRAKVKSA